MTRIIAGRFGGRRIEVPAGGATRPTSDRVREALFSQLDHELDLDGLRVLDLYAGSGALGLEALSRGAGHATFVDSATPATRTIGRNLGSLQAERLATVRATKISAFLAGPPTQGYDVVFLDPPYDVDDISLAGDLSALVAGGWLNQGALVVVERSVRSNEPAWPQGLRRFDSRRYGETHVWWAESPTEPEPA